MAATEEVSQSAGDQAEPTLLELLDLIEARLTKLAKIPKPKKAKKPARKAVKRVGAKVDKSAPTINDDSERAEKKAGQPVTRKRQALGKSLVQLRQKPQG